MLFSEDSRVKIPVILHLTRLGFSYLALRDHQRNEATNVFPDLFRSSVQKINSYASESDIDRLLQEVFFLLENEDLGKSFHERRTATDGLKLIDFTDFDQSTFNVVTELTYRNGDDEARPDITLLVNGMPLAFIEVKKLNNRDGTLAERQRINARFRNPKLRRFVNITQLTVFSNNMEYDGSSPEPLQGAFYASPSYEDLSLDYFREEESHLLSGLLSPECQETEDLVLADNSKPKKSPPSATGCSRCS